MANLGERMRLIRQYFNWTQMEAANILGVKQNMISRYERQEHQVPDDIKIKLHKLGIDLTWLLTGEGNMLRDMEQHVEIENLKKEMVALETTVDQVQANSATMADRLKNIRDTLFH